MRFLPVFLDLQAGPILLVGAGELARAKLRLLLAAGARIRWYRDRRPSRCQRARRRRCGADRACRRRSADRRSRRRDRGAVRGRRRRRACDVGAGQGGRPARQCDGRPRAFDLHLSGHRRSRRRGGRGRHRRRLAGGGAPRARAHRGDAAGADRRSRRLHRPLAQDRSTAALPRCRCAAASGSAWSTARSARWCSPAAATKPKRR